MKDLPDQRINSFMRLIDRLSQVLAILAIGGAIGYIILPAIYTLATR